MKLLIILLLSITLNANEKTHLVIQTPQMVQEYFDMGMKFYLGDSGDMNSSKAILYFKKACKLELYKACTNLGIIYYYGHGVPQNDTIAKAYFAESCIGKEALGCQYYKQIK